MSAAPSPVDIQEYDSTGTATLQCIDAAIAWQEEGASVIPLRMRTEYSQDGTPSYVKEPHSDALKKVYRTAKTEPRRITPPTRAELIKMLCHVGATGSPGDAPSIGIFPPPGMAIIDIDDVPPNPKLPFTPLTRTRRGWHVYVASDDEAVHTHENGEIRGRSGYTVVPPSVHPAGTPYTCELAPEGLGRILNAIEADLLPIGDAANVIEMLGKHIKTSRAKGSSESSVNALVSSPDLSVVNTEVNNTSSRFLRELSNTSSVGEERCVTHFYEGEAFVIAELDSRGIMHHGLNRVNCPFHDDTTPSAAIIRGKKDGRWVFTCQGCGATTRFGVLVAEWRTRRSLAEGTLSPNEIPQWIARRQHELGLLKPEMLVALPSPDLFSRRRAARALRLAESIRLQHALCFATTGSIRPLPFTGSFATDYAGVSNITRIRAISDLLEAGWLAQRHGVQTRTNGLNANRIPMALYIPTGLIPLESQSVNA